jgi:hypothetical protein
MGITAVLFAVRWYASKEIGFGDSEALYASYAIHPQPAYLDHPGLIGIFARALGGGSAPTPGDAHLVTALLATVLPWLVTLVAQNLGALRKHALAAGIVFALVPEIAIGLFAMTPDLLLAYLALGAIGLACAGLDEKPGSGRGAIMLALAGLSAGIGAGAKVSGLLILVGIAVAYAKSRHAKSIWSWIGIAAGVLVLVPIAKFESEHGWPMLHHRLGGIGFSWKGLGVLTAAQLAYVSPVLLVVAGALVVDLFRHRNDDDISRLFAWTTFVPLGALAILCLLHRGSEPHWIAPALLPLPVWAARRAAAADRPRVLGFRWIASGAAVGALFVALVHVWTLWTAAPKLAPKSYDPRLDITNELYGWNNANSVIAELAAEEDTVIVGPHWTICAQVQAGIPAASVGCLGESDFDEWLPRAAWQTHGRIVYVSDGRFPEEPDFPEHALSSVQHVTALRGGKIVRTFTISLFDRRARAELTLHRPGP